MISGYGTSSELGNRQYAHLDRPVELVTLMGQVAVSVAQLNYRNTEVINNSEQQRLTKVYFDTIEPILTINDHSKRFNSGVARVLGELIQLDPGPYPNHELRDYLANRYRLSSASATGVLSEARQTLRYWQFDENGSLLEMPQGKTGLREDLVFYPSQQKEDMPIPQDNLRTVRQDTPKSDQPIIVNTPAIKIREDWRTGQLYAVYWQGYVPPANLAQSSTGQLSQAPTPSKEINGQLKIPFHRKNPVETLPPLKIGEHANGQLYARWWPRYCPKPTISATKAPTKCSSTKIEGQQQLPYHDEDPFMQRVLGIGTDKTPPPLEQETPQKQFDQASPPTVPICEQEIIEPEATPTAPTLKNVGPNDSTMVFGTTDTYMQIAMDEAFKYIFFGGETPVVTDTATYLAFEKAIQIIGGYEETRLTGPVAKEYFNKTRVLLRIEMQNRIKTLGESIHPKPPKRDFVNIISTSTRRLDATPTKWMNDAACKGIDPNIFHPDKDAEDTDEVKYAKSICDSCNVKPDCLKYAVTTRQPHGIWGGLTEYARRNYIRRLRRKRTARTLTDKHPPAEV